MIIMNKYENKYYSSKFSFLDAKILKIFPFFHMEIFFQNLLLIHFINLIFPMCEINDFNSEDKIKSPVKTKIPRGEGSDAKRIAERLMNFDQKESEAYKSIMRRFSAGITHAELKRIAEIFTVNNKLRLDRDAKRDNRVLIKWFDENWGIIGPQFYRLHAYDEDNNPVFEENSQI